MLILYKDFSSELGYENLYLAPIHQLPSHYNFFS